MKHKHYDVVVAWAEGKEIQTKNHEGKWVDLHQWYTPYFHTTNEYRIKPEPIVRKLRIAQLKNSSGEYHYRTIPESHFNLTALNTEFVKWAGDVVEVVEGEVLG